MGTLQIMQLLPTPGEEPNSHEDASESLRAEQLIGVQISSPSHGFRVHGSLKSISRGGVQVLTPLAVPIRCPLRISIAGCRSVGGEALYCLKRSMLYQVGMVFSSRQKPNIALGDVATIDTLEPPFVKGRGGILDIGNSSVSILCKTAIAPEERVRLESSGWVLFGVVKDVVATSMVGRCLEVHLQAAFPAESSQRGALAVMPSATDAETATEKEEKR